MDALDGDVEVAFKRTLDGIVEREVEAAGRLPGRVRLPGDADNPRAVNCVEGLGMRRSRRRRKQQPDHEWCECEGTKMSRHDHPPVWKSNPVAGWVPYAGPPVGGCGLHLPSNR